MLSLERTVRVDQRNIVNVPPPGHGVVPGHIPPVVQRIVFLGKFYQVCAQLFQVVIVLDIFLRIPAHLVHHVHAVLKAQDKSLEGIDRTGAGQFVNVGPHVLDVVGPAIPPGEVGRAQIDPPLVVVLVGSSSPPGDPYVLQCRVVSACALRIIGLQGVHVFGQRVHLDSRVLRLKDVPNLPVGTIILVQDGDKIQGYLFGCWCRSGWRFRGGGWRLGSRRWSLGGRRYTLGRHRAGRSQSAHTQKVPPTELFAFHFFLLDFVRIFGKLSLVWGSPRGPQVEVIAPGQER